MSTPLESPPRSCWPVGLWLLQIVVPAAIWTCLSASDSQPSTVAPQVTWVKLVAAAWMTIVVVLALRSGWRNRPRAWRHQVLLSAVVTLLTLAAADALLYLSDLAPTIAAQRARSVLYRPAPFARHRMVANQHVPTSDGTDIAINSRGIRGPELAGEKTPGVPRLLFLGGSQVFGVDGPNWPELVEQRLNEAGVKTEVINAAVAGHASADSAARLLTELWPLQPDYVVVCHGWNDIKYFAQISPDQPAMDCVPAFVRDWRVEPQGLDALFCCSAIYRFVRWRVPAMRRLGTEGEVRSSLTAQYGPLGPEQLRLNLTTIVELSRQIGAQTVLCKQPRLATAELASADRERIRLGYVGLTYEALLAAFADCDRTVDAVAAASHCPVVDLHREMSGRPELFEDQVHLTPAGTARAAELVAQSLLPLLRSQPGKAAAPGLKESLQEFPASSLNVPGQ